MRITPIAFALVAHVLAAQEPSHPVRLSPQEMRIVGIFDERTGDPVEGVDIVDVATGNSVRTSVTGTASLSFLPGGGGLVRLRKLGYEMQTLLFTTAPADTVPITLVLHRLVELPEVRVVDSAPRYLSLGLRGFEERRRAKAAGTFIPESTIRKEESRNIGDVLRQYVPNAQLTGGGIGRVYLLQSPRCSTGGPPAVYLDGMLLSGEVLSPNTAAGRRAQSNPSATTPVNLAEFNLADLAAVEYYPTTAAAPPEYNRTLRSCGALLLWTREH